MPSDTLTTEAENAIQHSPEWLRLVLRDKFIQLDSSNQKKYAAAILSATYPYIDEVAFAVANIGASLLSHSQFNKDLLLENARLVYKADTLLDYVEIVDYIDSSTTKYKVANQGDTFELTIPKERYYWDIVHPIISDEACLCINPKNGGTAVPPYGKFWRDYLFNYPDTATSTVIGLGGTDTIKAGFVSPILRDQLLAEKIVWNNKNNTTSDNGAAGTITKWVLDVLVFNSGAERPIQPVRIFNLHQGRCGEHADFTGAAGRACLIPTNSALAMCNDHTWNDFYDTKWHGWEPVNGFIGDTTYYDTWWDDKMVFALGFRGDGYLLDVTNRYTYAVCTLTIFVKDAQDKPVDCAGISLVSTRNDGSTLGYATLHYTNTDGLASFVIGNDKPYYIRIDSDIGNYPQEGGYVVQIIDTSIAGQNYFWDYKFGSAMPDISVTQDTLPSELYELYKVELDFNLPEEIEHGTSLFTTDFGNRKQYFANFSDIGNIEFFICDEANFALYQSKASFKAHCISRTTTSGSVEFTLPTANKWYIVFSNEDQLKTGQVLSLNAKLYKDISGIEEISFIEPQITVSPIPSNSYTYITLILPSPTSVASLEIYDLSGRCVKSMKKQGSCLVKLDKNDLCSGIYFLKLNTCGQTTTKKIVRL